MNRPLLPSIAERLNEEHTAQHRRWNFTQKCAPDRHTGEPRWSTEGHHDPSGLYVSGQDGLLDRCQASLPRLLHGYNGITIKNPDEQQQAMDTLHSMLDEISDPVEPLVEFLRVDLVQNVPCDAAKVLNALRNARHPWFRKDQTEYQGSSVRFNGKERILTAYDKRQELKFRKGVAITGSEDWLRLELQLKTRKAVRELFGNDEDRPVTHIDFFHAYRIWRKAWLTFDPAVCATTKISLPALVAECEAQGFRTSTGQSAWDWYRQFHEKPDTQRRFLKDVQARKLRAMAFSFGSILPLLAPGDVVDLDSTGLETLHLSQWHHIKSPGKAA